MPPKKNPKSSLEQALDFLTIPYKIGEDQSTYCRIDENRAVSFNLTIGVGTPIEEDLSACPQIALFQAAIERAGMEFAITQLSPSKLLVRSGDFHAYVPCLDPSAFVWCQPDAAVAPLDERFIEALDKIAGLATTAGETVLETSIQLNDGSVVATNRSVIMEAWHGCSFPTGMLIPKLAYMKLRKAKKKITAFGFSTTSVTFYFEDSTWLFTKCFDTKWPSSVNAMLSSQGIPHAVDKSFFDAVKKVEPFSVGKIYVEGNLVSSHPFGTKEEGSGLSLPFEGERYEPRIYLSEDLMYISRHATKWNANARPDGTAFFGDNLRGVIFHEHLHKPDIDEDIPF